MTIKWTPEQVYQLYNNHTVNLSTVACNTEAAQGCIPESGFSENSWVC